jgi:hypothetical protein
MEMKIKRQMMQRILPKMFKGKVILIFGPRQVGKTTLTRQLAAASEKASLFLNCDDYEARQRLANASTARLRALTTGIELLVIDEAQRLENAGLILKLFADELPNVQVIATGSSAFELSDKVKEPLTGRAIAFQLGAISWAEMARHTSGFEEDAQLASRLQYGYYPDVVTRPGNEAEALDGIAGGYLYKDLLSLESLRKPALLETLLKALALRTGQEVSYTGLSQLVKASEKTVEQYIDLLEQAFIIFRLPSFNRNLDNELKKGRKIYFHDVGIRNALIGSFNPPESRTDLGALWENFIVAERRKWLHNQGIKAAMYFWRTTSQQEIDYIEEREGRLYCAEIKYKQHKTWTVPGKFKAHYAPEEARLVTRENYMEWIGS